MIDNASLARRLPAKKATITVAHAKNTKPFTL